MNLNSLGNNLKMDLDNFLKDVVITEKDVEVAINHYFNMKQDLVLNGFDIKNDKDFNKALVKLYRRLCELAISGSSEYNFLRGNTPLSISQLDEITLSLMFNKDASVQDIIKYIKNIDVDIYNLLYAERLVSTFYNAEYYCRDKETDDRVRFSIMLDTIALIKAIKFGLSKNEIDYIIDGDKFKKIFKGYQLVYAGSGLITFHSKSVLNYKEIAKYMNDAKNDSNAVLEFLSAINSTSINSSNYLSFILYNIDPYLNACQRTKTILPIDYYKILFLDKFNDILNVGAVASPLEIKIGIAPSNIFYTRKVLLPKNGVILLVKNHEFIESILIKEVLLDKYNNITFVTKYKDGTEVPNLVLLHEIFTDNFPQIICDHNKNQGLKSIDYVLDFFGIKDGAKEFIETDKNIEYDVISPTYWKYRNKRYISENDSVNHKGVVIKREFEVEIAPFIRKINGEASLEAKKLAKQLWVKLEDGYTIVKPHTRTYNKIR